HRVADLIVEGLAGVQRRLFRVFGYRVYVVQGQLLGLEVGQRGAVVARRGPQLVRLKRARLQCPRGDDDEDEERHPRGDRGDRVAERRFLDAAEHQERRGRQEDGGGG